MYKETLRIERQSLGEDHEDVAVTLQHLGSIFQKTGQLDEALKCFLDALNVETRRASASSTSSISPSSQESIGKIWNLVGNVYLQQGNTAAMMDSFTQALRIFRTQGLPDTALSIAGYNLYGLSKIHPPCAPTA